MSKLNVAVIFGGDSAECKSSINSAINVIDNLSREKYNIIPVYINDLGGWFLYEGKPHCIKAAEWENFGTRCQINLDRQEQGFLRISGERVRNIPVDIAIPLLRGDFSEGSIQGALEMGGIKYVGAGVLASALASDRSMAKTLAKSLGITFPKYLVFDSKELDDFDAMLRTVRYKIGYPCYIKPLKKGSLSSVLVSNKKELEEAMIRAFLYSGKIIVEKEIKGRELVCTMFALFDSLGFCENSVKFCEIREALPDGEIFPAPVFDKKTMSKAKESAIALYGAMGISSPAHFKFFLDEQTKNVVLCDINTQLCFADSNILLKFMNTGEILDRLIANILR